MALLLQSLLHCDVINSHIPFHCHCHCHCHSKTISLDSISSCFDLTSMPLPLEKQNRSTLLTRIVQCVSSASFLLLSSVLLSYLSSILYRYSFHCHYPYHFDVLQDRVIPYSDCNKFVACLHACLPWFKQRFKNRKATAIFKSATNARRRASVGNDSVYEDVCPFSPVSSWPHEVFGGVE